MLTHQCPDEVCLYQPHTENSPDAHRQVGGCISHTYPHNEVLFSNKKERIINMLNGMYIFHNNYAE